MDSRTNFGDILDAKSALESEKKRIIFLMNFWTEKGGPHAAVRGIDRIRGCLTRGPWSRTKET